MYVWRNGGREGGALPACRREEWREEVVEAWRYAAGVHSKGDLSGGALRAVWRNGARGFWRRAVGVRDVEVLVTRANARRCPGTKECR